MIVTQIMLALLYGVRAHFLAQLCHVLERHFFKGGGLL